MRLSPWKFAGAAVCLALALLLLWRLYEWYVLATYTFPRSSDDARVLLQAWDMVRGNWNLHGWSVPSDNFWLTESALYVAAVWIRGSTPSLLHTIPAMFYTAIVLLACFLAARPYRGIAAAAGALATFILIGLPSATSLMIRLPLRSTIHMGTIFFGLLALLVIEPIHRAETGAMPRRSRWTRIVVAAALLGVAISSDPLAGWMIWIPCLFVAGADIMREQTRRDGWMAAAWLAASLALANLLSHLAAATGGFINIGDRGRFVPIDGIGLGIKNLVQGWLGFFGGDLFGLTFSAQALWIAGRALMALLVIAAIYAELASWIRRRERGRWLDAVLAMICLTAVLEFVVSDKGMYTGVHYLVLPVIAGAILAGRSFAGPLSPDILAPRVAGVVLLFLGLVVSWVTFEPILAQPIAVQPEAPVIAWLEQHHLHEGYGSYWSASIITADTVETVLVRPVIVSPEGPLIQFRDGSSTAWYEAHPQFVLYRYPDDNWHAGARTSLAAASSALSGRVRTFRIGAFTVAIPVHAPRVVSGGALTSSDFARRYALPAGTTIALQARIAKGSAIGGARLIVGDMTNGYGMDYDGNGDIYLRKWVDGVLTNVGLSLRRPNDTRFHTLRLSVTVLSPNSVSILGSFDGIDPNNGKPLVDSSLDLTAGTWPVTAVTDVSVGSVRDYSVSLRRGLRAIARTR